jgi:tetratricopeptide (TPR) repeat protein
MTRRTVMISSTARDLPEHREEIRQGCERAGFEPRVMEHLPALDADAIKASLRIVEEADVYVGVFAYRYGYVPDGYDISITEMEYNRAVDLKKPRLIFFAHKDHPIKIEDVETGQGEARLKTLKDRLGKERVVTFFLSPKDLRAQVVEALTALGKDFDREKTGDAIASAAAKLHRPTSITAPPKPYVAHPYTLLQLRELVGRQAELNVLTDWVAKPGSPAFDARIFCFVAIGGMGKSALTWKWFNQIAPNEMKPLAGRMWWSFYESDATFENFLNRALCYVSGQNEHQVHALSWREREAQFLQHLNENPYLFVLDGLERIQIAYNRMDASRLADDEIDQQTANWAGLPATAAQSFVGQHRLRQTTDARAGALLRKLALLSHSRILVTSRLYPNELQLPTGYPRPGCYAYFLRGLSDDDSLGLWRALSVSGSRQELVPIFQSVENHPLLVQALASEVANYKKAPGDLARWRADHPQFSPTSLSLVQSRTHILEYALKGLSEKVREVLSMVVGFRMTANYDTLEALLVGTGNACDSAHELDLALTELEDRGLIGWDREANRYDAHPIVRSVVWRLTNAHDQRAVYAALEAYFEPMQTPDRDQVKSLADLTPAIELYHTLVGLERYDDAFIFFRDNFKDALYFRLAAHRQCIAWLESLFPDGVSGRPRLVDEMNQWYAIHIMALSFKYTGEPGRAASLFERSCKIAERSDETEYWPALFAELGDSLRVTGAIYKAYIQLRKSLILARGIKKDFDQGACTDYIGQLLCVTDNHATGLIALKRAQKFMNQQKQAKGVLAGNIAEQLLRNGDYLKAASLIDEALELAAELTFERDVIRSLLLRGLVALALCKLEEAENRLHETLVRARSVNQVELELPALIALAELELKRGHLTEAKVRLDDVWEITERGPYRLREADAHNVLAAIELAQSNIPAAIEAATNAYKAAWCDGPPYAYHWGLQKAKAHLAALGAPEPDLPPFDESKFEPLPDVEINPKDEYWVDPDKLD